MVTPSTRRATRRSFKYNPPNGGPADTDATGWIANRANELMAEYRSIARTPHASRLRHRSPATTTARRTAEELAQVINMDAISSGLRIGADPMGGAAAQYWEYIAENLLPNLTVVNPVIDPTWYFMTLDTDGKIRMDCSSPHAMASLVANRTAYDLSTGNDADADRHGIVTPDAGLMNPNHYLAVAIPVPVRQSARLASHHRHRQDHGLQFDDRQRGAAARHPGRGAGRLQVVRARPDLG